MSVSRLLFLAERFPPDIGGVASSARRISEALKELGIAVDVVVWSRYLQPGEVLPPQSETAKVYRIGLYRNWDMTMNHTLNVLEWLHQQHSYDAVWGHYLFPAGFLAVWFAGLQGIESIVSARGNDIDRGAFPPGDFARLRWTLERADRVTAVSRDLGRKIKLLCDRDDTVILKNAVDTDIFKPDISPEMRWQLREELGIFSDEIVVGFLGELREKKGQQFLIKALSEVRRNRPACLLIIGEVRPSQLGILQAYEMECPEDAKRVIITGYLSEREAIARYLQICDVFLLPSVWEGMPNALLEAMSCGGCAIASDAGGIPEIITHGENGFILPRHQLNHLGNAVLEFLELEEARKGEISGAARDRILAEFSLPRERERLRGLFD